jgi:hypothetical protein
MKCNALWQSLYKEHELFSDYLLSQNFKSPERAGKILTVFVRHPLPLQRVSIMSCKGEGRSVKEHTQTKIYIYRAFHNVLHDYKRL